MTTQSYTQQLTQFRDELYHNFDNRADTLMELIDAMCSNSTARSVVEYTLTSCFRRTYTALYKAIDACQWKKGQLAKLLAELIGIGGDQYLVLWEEWLNTDSYSDTFNGVCGILVDDEGNILRAATLITDEHHLHRGDDAFLLDNRAAWMTGNRVEQKLYIHLVDAFLNYEMVTLD